MAIYNENIVDIELTSGSIFRSFLSHTIGSGDVLANRFGVRVFRNGEPEDIGGNCFGLFVRADGGTVTISSGVVSGNVAYVDLPEACYAVEGNFTLAIKCQGGGVTGTLRIVDGVVSRTSTNAVVDPGTLVDSVDDLIEAIDTAVESIPADYTSLWTSIAPAFSTSKTYKTGEYVTYSGVLYRFMAEHAAGSWNAEHVIPADIGEAITAVTDGMEHNGLATIITDWINGKRIQNAGSALGEPATNVYFRYCKVPCAPGDVFVINAKDDDWSAYRVWAFAKSNGDILSYADRGSDAVNTVITAPDEAAYMVVNDYSASSSWSGVSYKGLPMGQQVQENTGMIKNILDDRVLFSDLEDKTQNGLTFSVDKKNRTVTVTGTATGTTVFPVAEGITGITGILFGGCPAGGASDTYNVSLYDNVSSRVAWNGEGRTSYEANPERIYDVAIVIFSGVNCGDGLVFSPVAFTGGEVMQVLADVNKYRYNCIYEPVSGVAFITHCGDSLFCDCYGFRLVNKETKELTAEKDGTEKIQLDTETIRYINFSGTTFSVSSSISVNTVAVAYRRTVTPILGNIIANYRMIQNGYIRDEYYINFDRTPIDAYLGYEDTDLKVSGRGYIIKSAGTKRYQVKNTSIPFTLTANTASLANKKILMIGDSFVARGYIQHYISGKVPSVQFIGTKTTQNYNFKSEGVSGSRLYYFTDPETSPFYFSGGLNFSQYLSENNLAAPDYVVINSAINHYSYNNADYGTYLENIKQLVNMVRAYSTGIKIYVTFGANYAMKPGSEYGYPVMRYDVVRQCCNAVYDAENIVVIPVDYALIDELDYTSETVNYFGNNISILSDCVHPAENTGFQKIANMIYNYLGI